MSKLIQMIEKEDIAPAFAEELNRSVEFKEPPINIPETELEKFFSSEESENFVNWVTGGGELSTDFGFSSFKDRIPYVAVLNLMIAIRRVINNASFLLEAEKRIFNREAFDMLDDTAKLEYYKVSCKSLQDSMETFRKFLVQNRDMLDTGNEDYNQIKKILGKLSDTKRKQMIGALKTMIEEDKG